MPEYIFPTPTHSASDPDGTWQGHRRRTPPSVNPGMDFACAYGSSVVAIKAGTVITAAAGVGSGGRYIVINHGDGSVTWYLHLSSIGVRVGQKVAQGERIGLSGASGYGSDHWYGPHCHLSLYIDGSNVDPMAHIDRTDPAASSGGTPITQEKEEPMIFAAVQDQVKDGKTFAVIILYGPGMPKGYHRIEPVNRGEWERFKIIQNAQHDTKGVGQHWEDSDLLSVDPIGFATIVSVWG